MSERLLLQLCLASQSRDQTKLSLKLNAAGHKPDTAQAAAELPGLDGEQAPRGA